MELGSYLLALGTPTASIAIGNYPIAMMSVVCDKMRMIEEPCSTRDVFQPSGWNERAKAVWLISPRIRSSMAVHQTCEGAKRGTRYLPCQNAAQQADETGCFHCQYAAQRSC